MNFNFNEGSVVICDTGQAGTLTDLEGSDAYVLLRNGDIWVGTTNRLRLPQSQEDLDAAPIDVEREVKIQKVKREF